MLNPLSIYDKKLWNVFFFYIPYFPLFVLKEKQHDTFGGCVYKVSVLNTDAQAKPVFLLVVNK